MVIDSINQVVEQAGASPVCVWHDREGFCPPSVERPRPKESRSQR